MQIFMQQQGQLQGIQSQTEGTTEPCDVEDQRSRTQMTPMNQELANNEREPNNNSESLSASLQSESKSFVTFVHVNIFFSFTWYGVTKKNFGKETQAHNFPSEMVMTLGDVEINYGEMAWCGVNWK